MRLNVNFSHHARKPLQTHGRLSLKTMQSIEATRSSQGERWGRVSGDFFRAIEGGKNKPIEAAADRLVAFACEEHDDCLSMLGALEIGYKAMVVPEKSSRYAGVCVLEGMEAYLEGLGVCHKLLVPSIEQLTDLQSAANEISRLSGVIQQTGKFRHTPPPPIPMIKAFAHSVSAEVRDVHEDHIPVVPIISPTAVEDKAHFESAYQPYVDILNAFGAFARDDDFDLARLRFEVIQAMYRQGHCDGIPAIASRVFVDSGVSFQDILRDPADDPEALGRMILTYLASLPKGDLLWSRIADLFTLPASFESGDEQYGSPQQDFSWKMLLFHTWLGEKMIIPAIASHIPSDALPEDYWHLLKPDGEVDRLFAHTVLTLSNTSAHALGMTLYNALTHPVAMLRRFHPDMSTAEAGSYCPMIYIAQAMHLGEGGSGLMISDRVIHRFLQDHWGEIVESVTQRLGRLPQARRNVHRVLDGIATDVLRDYDLELTRDILAYLRENFGGNLEARLADLTPQIDEVNQRILRELTEPVDYWPHHSIIHRLRFASESLPDMLGLESILMVFGYTATESIGFRFVLRGKSIGLSGELDPSTLTISWHIDETIFDQELLTVITLIVLASMRDYIKKGELVVREGGVRRPRSGPVKTPEENTEAHAVVYERPAPRRPVQYRRADPDASAQAPVVDAKELVEAIEQDQEEAGLTVRHVASFRRTYVDDQMVLQFAEAMRRLREAVPDAYDDALQYARDLRSSFRQPSADKRLAIEQLPPRLRLRPLLDPYTGEQLIDIHPRHEGEPLYRDTWVMEHTRPPLTDEEMFSFPVRYARLYVQAEGSALGFLDELTPTILGLKEGEKSL